MTKKRCSHYPPLPPHPNIPESLPFSTLVRTLANSSDLPFAPAAAYSASNISTITRQRRQQAGEATKDSDGPRTTSRTLAKRAFYIGMRLCYRFSVNGKSHLKHISVSLYARTPLDLSPHPYTSEPFPLTQTPFSNACTPLNRSRQMVVLELFIALKVHDDVWADGSELHLGQPEACSTSCSSTRDSSASTSPITS